MTELVVRLHASHHTGMYRRAGFVFGVIPQTVSVTDEQKEIIMNDPYLIIMNKPSAKVEEVQSGTEELTRKEIIAKLKEKGLIQGKDFSHMAKKVDLLALL